MERITVGSKGVNNLRQSGYSYVSIPKDVERDEYIQSCFKSGIILIRNESGFTSKALCSEEDLMNIKWPEKSDGIGSPLIWLKLSTHDFPVVMKVIKNKEKLNRLRYEGQKVEYVNFDGVDIINEMNAALGRLNLIISSSNKNTSLNIISKGENQSSVNIESRGTINLKNTDFFRLLTQTGFELKKTNDGFIDESLLGFDQKNLFRIWGNVNGEHEPAVLGLKLKAVLESFIDEVDEFADSVSKLTVNTPVGPSSVPINSFKFVNVREALSSIKNNLDDFLSKYITID